MKRKGDPSPSTRLDIRPRVKRRLAALAVLAAIVMPAAAQCGTNPSGNPFGSCPSGTTRIRDVTRPPGQQWVCVR